MVDNKINVSGLLDILHSALDGTDLTWRIIDTNSRDVHKLLQRWELPDERSTEDEKLLECTCDKPQENEPVELARDIEHLLDKAKATREKVSEKKLQDKPHKTPLGNGIKPNPSLNLQIKKGTSIFQSRHVSSSFTSTKPTLPMSKCIESRERPKSDPGRVTSKLSIGSNDKNPKRKKSLIPFQTTYQRDFAVLTKLKNKRQIYPLPSLEKKSSNNCELKEIGSRSSSGKSNLEKPAVVNLIGSLKRTTVSNKDHRASTALANSTKVCPVHNAVLLKRSRKKIVSLQVAVDILGVPMEVLKPLKSYYQYISKYDDNVCSGTDKSLIARNKFVTKLTGVNKQSWNEIANDPVVILWKEYSSVLQDTCAVSRPTGGGDHSTFRDLLRKLELLECAFQRAAEFDISPHNRLLSSDEKEDSVSVSVNDDSKEWALAGIWNKNCQIFFSGMKQIMNMRYQEEKHCQLFQGNLQKIQTLQLQINIFEVMRNEIFPQMKKLDCNSPGFVKFYKMCSALCDIGCVTIPVLVKT